MKDWHVIRSYSLNKPGEWKVIVVEASRFLIWSDKLLSSNFISHFCCGKFFNRLFHRPIHSAATAVASRLYKREIYIRIDDETARNVDKKFYDQIVQSEQSEV